jgi:hypothetical protein
VSGRDPYSVDDDVAFGDHVFKRDVPIREGCAHTDQTLDEVAETEANSTSGTVVYVLEFGQEIMRNCEIMRLAWEGGGPLRSGVEAPDGVLSDAQVIFPSCEVHGPEYSPGPKFPQSDVGPDLG